MAIYRVKSIPVDGVVHVRYASSDAAARKEATAIREAHSLGKSDVTTDTVTPASGKAGLIDWLNREHSQLPEGFVAEKPAKPAKAAKAGKKK